MTWVSPADGFHFLEHSKRKRVPQDAIAPGHPPLPFRLMAMDIPQADFCAEQTGGERQAG